MERKKPKLPTAARRDMNTPGTSDNELPLPDGILKISVATNFLASFRDRSPSPEVVHFNDIEWRRSNNPVELDAPTITMTAADQAHLNRSVALYPTSKICKFMSSKLDFS